MANIGINLVEVDGRATPSIQGAATSVAGFLIRSMRGVPGRLRQVTNFTEFVEYFGGFVAAAQGAYAVKGFFDNGGALAYVARIVDTTSAKKAVAATVVLTGNAGLTVTAAYRGQDDPGEFGLHLSAAVTINAAGNGDPKTWNLIVYFWGKVVERWDHLPINPGSANKINDEFTGSKYVRLVYPAALLDVVATPVDVQVPPQPVPVALLLGEDDEMTAGEIDTEVNKMLGSGGAGVFDTTDVQLLACPETCAQAVVAQGVSYCAQRGDCVFITHTPESDDATGAAAKALGLGVRAQNVYGAAYYPFIRVSDPLGTARWIPPTGHVMGVYARTERERGIWKAPAGVNASVRGALDVKYHISDTTHTLMVKNAGINAVRYIAGQGVIIDSSRTLSSNPLWQYVNVRLLFNYVKSSLKGGLRWVVQEPNDDRLWNKVKFNSVTPFLMDLWRRGAFGPGSPSEVFSVKIDNENNPPANIQLGVLNVEVYFYPSRPAETFIITVGQQEGGPTANES